MPGQVARDRFQTADELRLALARIKEKTTWRVHPAKHTLSLLATSTYGHEGGPEQHDHQRPTSAAPAMASVYFRIGRRSSDGGRGWIRCLRGWRYTFQLRRSPDEYGDHSAHDSADSFAAAYPSVLSGSCGPKTALSYPLPEKVSSGQARCATAVHCGNAVYIESVGNSGAGTPSPSKLNTVFGPAAAADKGKQVTSLQDKGEYQIARLANVFLIQIPPFLILIPLRSRPRRCGQPSGGASSTTTRLSPVTPGCAVWST